MNKKNSVYYCENGFTGNMFEPKNEDLLQKYAFHMYCSRMSIFGVLNTNNHSFESSFFAHFDRFWISKLTFFLWKRFWRCFSPRMKIYFKITFFTCIALEWAFFEFWTQEIIVLSQAFLLILIAFGFQNWRFFLWTRLWRWSSPRMKVSF